MSSHHNLIVTCFNHSNTPFTVPRWVFKTHRVNFSFFILFFISKFNTFSQGFVRGIPKIWISIGVNQYFLVFLLGSKIYFLFSSGWLILYRGLNLGCFGASFAPGFSLGLIWPGHWDRGVFNLQRLFRRINWQGNRDTNLLVFIGCTRESHINSAI